MALPKPSSSSRLEVYLPHGQDQSASQHHIKALKMRITHKRARGEKLTAVEAYFARRLGSLEYRLFAPSKFAVLLQVFGLLIKPIPIVLVLALIIAAENNSAASWFSPTYTGSPRAVATAAQQEHETEIEAHAERELDERSSSVSWNEGLIESINDQLALIANVLKPADSRPSAKYRGLVEFISGVIAVYYPSERNAGSIARQIVEISDREAVDPVYIASLIAVESSFRTRAKSRVGATGLMQLKPSTAREVFQKAYGTNARPRLTDPKTNIELGILYLKHLERHYRGNREHALAAYNWGPGNVNKALKRGSKFPTGVRKYASRILARTLRWQKNFEAAAEQGLALERLVSARSSDNA